MGKRNGINEEDAPLWNAAEAACGSVFECIEEALQKVHGDGPPENEVHHWPDQPPWWQTHGLGWIFGQADRWGQERRCGTLARVFSVDPPLISLLSGDAEGADTLIRSTALARGEAANRQVVYELLRVTPEAPQQVKDGLGVGEPIPKNPQIDARVASGDNISRPDARERAAIVRQRAYTYRAQSEALRHHCDLLLAIWDPDAEGKAGGTSESVEAALREQIPVVAIRINGEKAEKKAEIDLIEDLNQLRALQAQGGRAPRGGWEDRLHQVIQHHLGFPDSHPSHEEKERRHRPSTAYQPRTAFAAFRADEPLHPIWPARFWRCFNAALKWRAATGVDESPDQAKTARQKFLKTLVGLARPDPPIPMPDAQDDAPAAIYKRVRDRASSSGMSGIFGDAHRGGILLSYLLASAAVLLAIIAGILHVWHSPAWLLAGVAFAEIVAIFLMWALQVSSTADGWNAAYTDTRILAEALRMMDFLAPLGVRTPLPRLPYYLRQSEDAAKPDRSWSIWYFRALVRMAPLRTETNQDLAALRGEIRGTLEKQIKYHKAKALENKILHRTIERLVPAIFGVVGVYAVLHFWDVAIGLHLPGLFGVGLVISIAGPALIAGLHGFASQVEANRLHLRSSSMQRLLTERINAIDSIDLSEPTRSYAVWGLATEGLAAASLLMDETAGWSMLYRNADIHAG